MLKHLDKIQIISSEALPVQRLDDGRHERQAQLSSFKSLNEKKHIRTC